MHSAEPAANRQIAPPLDLGLPYWFHLFFPDRALTTDLRILVVGCDDGLAVHLARANRHARITALDMRPEVLAATGQAARQQDLANLEPVEQWPGSSARDEGFDLIYYNQPLWPDEPPQSVLAAAAGLLRLEGSLHLTVRAKYGWSGVAVVQELLERLGVHPDAGGYGRAREIVAALGQDHPWNLLGPDPRLRSDDLLADWLGAEEPGYSVPDIYQLLADSGLCLQRFTYQPYYLPQCSPLARTPLLKELRQLPPQRQHALMELYWPGMRYHLAVACRTGRPVESFAIDFDGADWLLYAPLLPANLPLEQDGSVGAQMRLCWRAAGMPQLSVALGGFQHRLLRALDRAEELAEVVSLAGLSGDPQLRDEWARDFFQMMADYDFLHFRICHSAREPSAGLPTESGPQQPQGTPWNQLAQLSELQSLSGSPVKKGDAHQLEAGTPDTRVEAEVELPALSEFPAEAEPEIEPLGEGDYEAADLYSAMGEPADAVEHETDSLAATPPTPAPIDLLTPRKTSASATEMENLPAPAALEPAAENLVLKRISYEACPLCAGSGHEILREVTAQLAIEGQSPRVAMPWVRCNHCSHVFTAGYFAGDSWRRILQHVIRWRGNLRRAIGSRREASRVVSTITALRESAAGRWLDIGPSNSGLLCVASEFGYEANGIDCCKDAAELLAGLGYSVTTGSLFDRTDGPFDVVSLSSVVDIMPFPPQALSYVHRLLAPRGLLYVSAMTSDSLRWKKLDLEGANPYWGRLDRYHVFHRRSLFHALRNAGFEPCSYGASGTDGVSMEVIACKP